MQSRGRVHGGPRGSQGGRSILVSVRPRDEGHGRGRVHGIGAPRPRQRAVRLPAEHDALPLFSGPERPSRQAIACPAWPHPSSALRSPFSAPFSDMHAHPNKAAVLSNLDPEHNRAQRHPCTRKLT